MNLVIQTMKSFWLKKCCYIAFEKMSSQMTFWATPTPPFNVRSFRPRFILFTWYKQLWQPWWLTHSFLLALHLKPMQSNPLTLKVYKILKVTRQHYSFQSLNDLSHILVWRVQILQSKQCCKRTGNENTFLGK